MKLLYHKTSYRYDQNGNCIEIILPDQNRIYRHYDADNLLLCQ